MDSVFPTISSVDRGDNRAVDGSAGIGAGRARGRLIWVWLLAGLLLTANARAAFEDTAVDGPWRIVADEMYYNQQADQYIASGDVTITNGQRELSADFIRYDKKTGIAHAIGRVRLTAGNDVILGDRAEIDLEKQTGTVYNGSVFVQMSHFHIKAERIQKTGEQTYYATNASITTCDGDRPDWKITGTEVDVTLEGYGVVHSAAMWARKVPFLYSPVLVFPAKRKRQSGLLVPEFGYSDRKGTEFNQPYFWAINDQMDATLYGYFMSERGLKGGLEYRYILSDESQGVAMFDYLNDRRVDDGSPGSDQWGYTNDTYLRPNAERTWFRMKHDQKLPWKINAKLDLDVVSDQDYLLEFEDGHSGFNKTYDYFLDTFGRGIADYNETTRINRLNFSRSWDQFSSSGELVWNDDVAKRRWEASDDTLHYLPRIEFDGAKQKIGRSPLFWQLDTSYTHFYRNHGTRGQRGDVYARAYWPYAFQHYFTIEPSLGLRETVWSVDRWEDPAAHPDRQFNRQIYDFKVDMSTEVYRTYAMGVFGIDRLKHAVRPQIVYDFTPQVNQDRNPKFDSLDKVEKKSVITYSLTNTFTARSPVAAPPSKSGRRKNEPPQYDYRQFGYLKLSQSYDINEARDAADPEPFSDIEGKLELEPVKYLLLNADAKWSPYTNRFTAHNTALTLTDDRGDKLFNEYRFTEAETESILTALDVVLTARVTAYGKNERNMKDGKNIETGLGLRYTTQCWDLDLGYRDKEDEVSLQVTVNLYGLGQAGTSFGSPF